MANSMSYETAVIPPVGAGRVQSSIDFDYSGYEDGESFSASGEHEWTFDGRAYTRRTGLDIGGSDPYVAQENGHSLRLVTDYTWMYSEVHDTPNYTLSIEEQAVRGTTSLDEVFFTRCGHYRLDDTLTVVNVEKEQQPYRIREYDDGVDHYGVHPLKGHTFDSGEHAVRAIHSGTVGPSVLEKLHDLLVYDSPDDAVTADTYLSRQDRDEGTTTSPSSAD